MRLSNSCCNQKRDLADAGEPDTLHAVVDDAGCAVVAVHVDTKLWPKVAKEARRAKRGPGCGKISAEGGEGSEEGAGARGNYGRRW